MKIRKIISAALAFVMLGSTPVFAQLTETLDGAEYITLNKSELRSYDSGRDIGKADNYQLKFEIPFSEISDIPFVDNRYCFRLDINNGRWSDVLVQDDWTFRGELVNGGFRDDVFTNNIANYYWDASNYGIEGAFDEHYETSQYVRAYREGYSNGKRSLYTSNYQDTVRFDYPLLFEVGSSGVVSVDVYIYDGQSDYYKSKDSDYKLIGSVDIAYVEGGNINVSCYEKEIGSQGTLEPLKITDTNYASVAEGTEFTITLDGGDFTAEPEVTAEGKFEGLCELEMDPDKDNVMHLRITGDTPQGSGSITVDNMQVSGDNFDVLMMNISDSHGYTNRNLQVAAYNADLDAAAEESSETTTQAVTQTTAQPQQKVVEIPVGQSYYTVDGTQVAMDSPAFISNGYTMLPLRAVAGIMGISDIDYNSGTKTAVLEYAGTRLEVTAGSDVMYINGVETAVDTAAVISGSRLYLPMRAIARAFGLEDMDFDTVSKTVRIVID